MPVLRRHRRLRTPDQQEHRLVDTDDHPTVGRDVHLDSGAHHTRPVRVPHSQHAGVLIDAHAAERGPLRATRTRTKRERSADKLSAVAATAGGRFLRARAG